jgi:hypothetical protein
MKKLWIIGLLFVCNMDLHALQDTTTSINHKIGQLCGDDCCDCHGLKRPEHIN